MVKHFSDLDLSKQYTFKDYLSWQFQERVEHFRGYIAKKSPAPNTFHQEYSGNIYTPSNSKKEMNDKYDLYEEAGVKEYWVVFPEEQAIQIYEWTNGRIPI